MTKIKSTYSNITFDDDFPFSVYTRFRKSNGHTRVVNIQTCTSTTDREFVVLQLKNYTDK